MKQEASSTSASSSPFVMTCGARSMAANPGRACRPRVGAEEVTSSGLPIDQTNGTGHGFQYQAWSTAAPCSFGQFSRSTDGGFTWQSPLSIPNSPVWGTLDVAINGNLFIGGASSFSSPFWCIRSSNAQNPAVTPTFD